MGASEKVDVRQLFKLIRQRSGMYLLDGKYSTYVAFVVGCDCVADCLQGFNDWVHQTYGGTGETPYHWSAQFVHSRFPERFNTKWLLTDDENELVVADLFDALDAFLKERPSTFQVLTVNSAAG